jgi:Phosphotransferase enzyme family
LSRPGENPVDVDALVARINSLHRTAFALQGRTKIGESGAAYILRDAFGAQYVLKFGYGAETRTEQVQQITKRLRDVGYPAPRYICVGNDAGVKYSVQAMMPGKPAHRITAPMVDELIAINRLQAGIGGDLPAEWPSRVVDGVMNGFERYCVIDTLRREPSTRAILETLQELVVRNAGEISATGDIVHWDFNPGNVLVDRDRITGVIDWEGACAGDRGFDLATLLFYSYDDREVREPLKREVLDCSGHGALAVYLAHMVVRQVDWSMRHHGLEAAARWIRIGNEIISEHWAKP